MPGIVPGTRVVHSQQSRHHVSLSIEEISLELFAAGWIVEGQYIFELEGALFGSSLPRPERDFSRGHRCVPDS